MNYQNEAPLMSAIEACASAAAETRLARAIAYRLHLDEPDYYRLLGLQWPHARYLWPMMNDLRRDLEAAGPDGQWAMMSEAEAAIWELLPETFDVYRGCYWENKDGLTWSRQPEVAAQFLSDDANWREASPLLVRGVAYKRGCVVKLCGERVDIISAEVGARGVEQLAPRTH